MEYLVLVFVVIGLYTLVKLYNWYYNKKNIGYFEKVKNVKKLLLLTVVLGFLVGGCSVKGGNWIINDFDTSEKSAQIEDQYWKDRNACQKRHFDKCMKEKGYLWVEEK